MDITFIVPCKDLSGGLRVVAAHGNGLLQRAHRVTIVYPKRRLKRRQAFKRWARRKLLRERDHLDFFKGTLLAVPGIEEEYIPDGDCLVATAWETAQWVKDFPDRCGRKFYLIQGYEIWAGKKEAVDATFHYPFKKAVVSSWLKKLIEQKSGEKDIPVIPNGRDFSPPDSCERLARKYDIGMVYSPVIEKQCMVGFKALHDVMESFPGLKIALFGSEKPGIPMPRAARFFLRPSREKIRRLYLDTRIWISSSRSEGFCLPALEAISLGSVVVATNSLGIEDIIDDGENGLLVEPGNPPALADKIRMVLEDTSLEARLRVKGIEKSKIFSWKAATDQLEKLLSGGS
ncbi:MAG: glycosyltransferase family 4 protein [Deltaproteobacteria bacterium]|nr:glycosyltransferase family 4 protein [Deltaproteobacteria bacterium]